ncbi:MAG: hypothetical protein WA908_01895 [Pontixanthobacter sp.]
MDQIVQLALSLAAVLALGWLAARLKLGGDRKITNEDDARVLAEEAMPGFVATEIAIDRAGYGALLRDADGRVLMLRRHGAHFAARILERRPEATLDRDMLTIEVEDRPFGAVTLDLGQDAPVWAASLRRMAA